MAEGAWPGRERRSPRIHERSYLVHRPLSRSLRSVIEKRLAEAGGRLGIVVDVGCGGRPYYPWFDGRCDRYVGVDIGPGADIQAPSEALPLSDGCADVVLSTQVLEHVDDPRAAVAEIGRILQPGGVALVSTHGVRPYHPTPQDYWRWTGSGLRKLFEDSHLFQSVEIVPCGGTIACLASLAALYLALVGDRLRRRGGPVGAFAARLLVPWVGGVNLAGRVLDGMLVRQRDHARANTMSANYLVVATR